MLQQGPSPLHRSQPAVAAQLGMLNTPEMAGVCHHPGRFKPVRRHTTASLKSALRARIHAVCACRRRIDNHVHPVTTPQEAIDNYRPSAATCSAECWNRIGDTVRATVNNAGVATTARQVRPYLGTLTGLLAWMDSEGYETDIAVALVGPAVEAYTATLTSHQATHRSRLRKLAVGNGLDPNAGVTPRYTKREFQPPYTDDQIGALWDYAQALTNRQRGRTIGAVVALGAGCGLRVRELQTVTAADVHNHNGVCSVHVHRRCIPVLDVYTDWVRHVATQRPTGALVGNATGPNAMAKVSGWVRNQPGVPDLSVYRLRSTWLCTLLSSDIAVTRVMAWAGLTKYNSLDGYRPYLHAEDVTCPV